MALASCWACALYYNGKYRKEFCRFLRKSLYFPYNWNRLLRIREIWGLSIILKPGTRPPCSTKQRTKEGTPEHQENALARGLTKSSQDTSHTTIWTDHCGCRGWFHQRLLCSVCYVYYSNKRELEKEKDIPSYSSFEVCRVVSQITGCAMLGNIFPLLSRSSTDWTWWMLYHAHLGTVLKTAAESKWRLEHADEPQVCTDWVIEGLQKLQHRDCFRNQKPLNETSIVGLPTV